MGKSNRMVFKAVEGPHKGHVMVANRKMSNYAGRKLLTTTLRCFTCYKFEGNDHVTMDQVEIRRDK